MRFERLPPADDVNNNIIRYHMKLTVSINSIILIVKITQK